MSIKISVIIPVFNTESYIANCLNSICSQTLKDLEIICINDASKDNSINILNDFANKDSRIKMFNWDLIEFLFTSNEAPIENMQDKKPEYRKILNDNDLFRISLFPYISEGIFKFVKDYTKIFGINNFNFDANQAFEYIKCFWQNLSFLDVYMLSQIKHPTDSAQQVYVSLTTTDEERVKILNKKVGKKIELLHN